jgi:hypothetical protein
MSEHEAANTELAGKIVLRTFIVSLVFGAVAIGVWLF